MSFYLEEQEKSVGIKTNITVTAMRCYKKADLDVFPLKPGDLGLVHLAKFDHLLPSGLRPVYVTDDGAECG